MTIFQIEQSHFPAVFVIVMLKKSGSISVVTKNAFGITAVTVIVYYSDR